VGYRRGFCKKLLCLIEPIPAGSKKDLLLAKAELISDGLSTSVITYFRKEEKLCNCSQRRVRM